MENKTNQSQKTEANSEALNLNRTAQKMKWARPELSEVSYQEIEFTTGSGADFGLFS